MKRIYLLWCCVGCITITSLATTWTVQVANYQFTPSTVNAVVGDVIHFQWVSGDHTTTSTAVPQGASTWNAPMSNSYATYDYTVSVIGTYSYYCVYHPDMTGTINVSSSLPVKFGELLTSENAAGHITLTWQSLTETNLEKYLIKRSPDGNNFTEMGAVQVKSNASGPVSYSYTDTRLTAGQKYYYYYIEAVDRDGSKTLSPIRLHRVKNAVADIITSISPNPITSAGHMMIKFNAESPGKIMFAVYDNTGKMVKQTQMLAVMGVNNSHWHIGGLAPGKYILKCQLGKQTETTELLVVQ